MGPTIQHYDNRKQCVGKTEFAKKILRRMSMKIYRCDIFSYKIFKSNFEDVLDEMQNTVYFNNFMDIANPLHNVVQ